MSLPRQRVLVVDDSRAMQAIIRRVLESPALGPCEVETVASGEQALEAIERRLPGLVLSDWHMPGMSGIELLQTLRQLGHGDLAVGFVTTETTPALLQQARTNGAAFIIHKPFNDAMLVAAVAGALGTGPAAAAAPPPPAELADPANGVRTLRRFIQAWMPGVPFRVIEGERLTSAQLTPRNLLTLYQDPGGSLCALAAANMPALCMLGGGAIQAEPRDIRRAIQEGSPNPELLDSAGNFFREAAGQLDAQLGVGGASFKAAQLVGSDFAKLRAAVDGPGLRADYRLSVPGYGDGRLSFLRTP